MKQELLELASELERIPVVAIDIGTTKVSVIIARASFNVDQYISEGRITPNNLRLIIDGMGVTPSFGMSDGSVYNIVKVSNSIKRAIDLAKIQVGIDGNTRFQRVLFSVAGVELKKEEISQSISFEDAGHIVTREDVKRLFARAKNSATNSSNVIHVIPTEFSVKQGNREVYLKPIINEVIGAVGDVLIGKFTLVSIDQKNVKILEKAIEQVGLEPDEVVLQPLASTLATTTPSAHETGVLVIDIGGGTTDLLYMKDHRVIEVSSIDIAGNTVDSDISKVFNIPLEDARKLKEKFGTLALSKKKQLIDISIEGRDKAIRLDTKELYNIIASRYAELFYDDIPRALETLSKNFGKRMYQQSADTYSGGEIPFVVLTGGGSNLAGIEVFAMYCFRNAIVKGVFRNNVEVVKRGPEGWIDKKQSIVRFPSDSNSTTLIHSTAIGMIVHYIQEKVADIVYSRQKRVSEDNTIGSKLFQVVKNLFKGLRNPSTETHNYETDNDETF